MLFAREYTLICVPETLHNERIKWSIERTGDVYRAFCIMQRVRVLSYGGKLVSLPFSAPEVLKTPVVSRALGSLV